MNTLARQLTDAIRDHEAQLQKKALVDPYLCRSGCRMDARNHLGLSYGDICQTATFAKLNLSLDDYKELVFLALMQNHELELPGAKGLMMEYAGDLPMFYDDNLAPNVAATGMVLNYLGPSTICKKAKVSV